MFTVLDPRDFADVFSGRLPSLLEAMAADGDVLTVAAHLVQSPGVGRTFSALLARHLTDERLSALDDPRSAVSRPARAMLMSCAAAELPVLHTWSVLAPQP